MALRPKSKARRMASSTWVIVMSRFMMAFGAPIMVAMAACAFTQLWNKQESLIKDVQNIQQEASAQRAMISSVSEDVRDIKGVIFGMIRRAELIQED